MSSIINIRKETSARGPVSNCHWVCAMWPPEVFEAAEFETLSELPVPERPARASGLSSLPNKVGKGDR
jgi:hypothetical protein